MCRPSCIRLGSSYLLGSMCAVIHLLEATGGAIGAVGLAIFHLQAGRVHFSTYPYTKCLQVLIHAYCQAEILSLAVQGHCLDDLAGSITCILHIPSGTPMRLHMLFWGTNLSRDESSEHASGLEQGVSGTCFSALIRLGLSQPQNQILDSLHQLKPAQRGPLILSLAPQPSGRMHQTIMEMHQG